MNLLSIHSNKNKSKNSRNYLPNPLNLVMFYTLLNAFISLTGLLFIIKSKHRKHLKPDKNEPILSYSYLLFLKLDNKFTFLKKPFIVINTFGSFIHY